MPIIEVDDATAAAMSQNGIKYEDRTKDAEVARRLMERTRKLENGPRRSDYMKLLSDEFPELTIPDHQITKPINDRVDALTAKFDEYLDAQKKEREERETRDREERANKTVAQGRHWLRGPKKLDDAGVEEVEGIMKSEGIPNYEAAYLMWKDRQPPPPADLPSANIGRSLDWFKEEADQPDKTLLLKDPLAYRAKRGRQILNDLRTGKIDEFGRPTNQAA